MDISILPKSLQDRAVILSKEPAWSKENAQQVIKFLATREYAVLGVELWLAKENVPKVIGWSDYDITESEDWIKYVEQNAEEALAILEKVPDANVLYNLIWIGEND